MQDESVSEQKSAISPAATQSWERLQRALSLHQSGQLAQAQAIYEEILRLQPAHPDAINLSGAIAIQTGNPQTAVDLFGRAIEIDPTNVVAYCNSALALAQLGQFDAALASYDRAIALDADLAEAHFNRGNVLRELKQWEAALASYQRAIETEADYAEAHLNCGHMLRELKQWEAALASYDQAILLLPDYEEAHFNRGIVLRALRQWDAALTSYDRAIALNPTYAQGYSNRGNVLADLKRLDAALVSYDQAIALQPDYAEAYFNRGNALRELKQWGAALASYDRAIALKPDYAESHSNRGVVLKEFKQWDAALASFDRAIALKPDYAESYSNRGVVLTELKRLDEALASYDRAIALNPDHAEAYINRAHALVEFGQLDAARVSCDRAIALKADFAEAYFNRSISSLLVGDLDNGWIDYEWRQRSNDAFLKDDRTFVQPRWLGKESIAGKTILLYGEQGLGDTLQFCRYVKPVANLGASVILEVQKPLESLLATLEGVSRIVARGSALPDFDYQCPLMSLPLAFKTTLTTIPSAAKYLTADVTKVTQWQAKLGPKTTARIGLAWSGSTLHRKDHSRSIPLADLIQYLPGKLQYVSLQKDVRESDRQTLLSNSRLLEFSDDLNDFSDTAALCSCMDAVISVDTSLAHLSGSLGRNTWILLPSVPDWRWLLDRDDSPWYPSVRLYRQRCRGDWGSVLERVKADLIQTFDI